VEQRQVCQQPVAGVEVVHAHRAARPGLQVQTTAFDGPVSPEVSIM
jgi:hypothetical protein